MLKSVRSTLFIFDIDGTLTDSTRMDNVAFLETFYELYKIDLSNEKWSEYNHVTDVGLCHEIIKKFKGKMLSKAALAKIHKRFCNKVKTHILKEPITEINGASNFLQQLKDRHMAVAMATGGWRKTAIMKLQSAGIPFDPFTLATSNDNHKRRTIMNVAIARAQFEYQKEFNSFLYFGDGTWDAKTCQEMNIPMVGVVPESNVALSSYDSVKLLIKDFENSQDILLRIANMEVFNSH